APMHPGQGPGLSLHDLGEIGGSDTVSLLQTEIPSHSHTVQAFAGAGNRLDPPGNSIARANGSTPYIPGSPTPATVNMADQTITPAGGNLPHNNLMPYLTLNFCIALQGVYPPRT